MFLTLHSQSRLFLLACLGGFAAGALYVLLDSLRRVSRHPFRAGLVCDSLFWLVLTAAFFVFAVTAARGDMRGYLFWGAGLGAVLFWLTLARPLGRGLVIIFSALAAVLGCVTRALRRFFGAMGTFLRKKTRSKEKNPFHLRQNRVK